MPSSNMNRRIACVLGISLLAPLTAGAADGLSPYVDADGRISLPADFRGHMVHLGSWFVPDGEASGFHDVYTEAETAAAYRASGRFPDGATLVKELRSPDTADYTTGKGVHSASTHVKQWFVMVKDATGRFPTNPVWGDGWGWALFKPDAADTNLANDYRSDCLGCHVPAKGTDWIYVQGYPTLSGGR